MRGNAECPVIEKALSPLWPEVASPDMKCGISCEARTTLNRDRISMPRDWPSPGASGGGLQTFYAGAVDERFDAVMPAVALWPMSELAAQLFLLGGQLGTRHFANGRHE